LSHESNPPSRKKGEKIKGSRYPQEKKRGVWNDNLKEDQKTRPRRRGQKTVWTTGWGPQRSSNKTREKKKQGPTAKGKGADRQQNLGDRVCPAKPGFYSKENTPLGQIRTKPRGKRASPTEKQNLKSSARKVGRNHRVL